MDHAELVAWVCVLVGVLVLGVGCVIGLRNVPADADRELRTARASLATATGEIAAVQEQVSRMRSIVAARRQLAADEVAAIEEIDGRAVESTAVVEEAAQRASASAETASSAIEQVGSVISSLPERLRFAGLLVLVGTVLISVGTVQFGGTSLF
ncbi:hypothetical protein [Georgenia sp. H159]|uniref:hypothetical protein n=1 Tax=Georgenia sp. H159 TaxID=3076115 RepID=UPI002D77D31C|nr:hypothetical protein [Georgenia sp. H159]